MKRAIFFFLLVAGVNSVFGQTTLCNREWETVNAFPDTIDLTMTAIDNNNCAVVVGNTKTVNQGTNLLTVKYNANGTVCWQQQYNGSSNGPDFGSALAVDAAGAIYVTGASWSNTTNSYDFITLKYSSTGNLLWSASYNGTGNQNDITAALVVDNAGNVFITGASTGTGNALNTDYVTIKYNSSGVQQWIKRYNFANLPDIPVGLVLDNAGNVFVAGSSGSSFFNADITIVKYNSSGVQTGLFRHNLSGNGYDKATAIKADNNGNVFVAGGVFQGSSTNDFCLVKLNNTLSLLWAQYYNGENLEDCANALELDAAGNAVVTGWTKKQNGGKDFTTIRYSGTGTMLWTKRETAAVVTSLGEAHKLAVDNTGNTYVTGEMTNANGNKDYLTIKYDSNGQKVWQNFFNNPVNAGDKSYALSIRNNTLYVNGKSFTGANDQYATVKYSFLNTPLVIDTAGAGGMAYAKGEIVVRFDPASVITTKVNDKDIQFGFVHEFITPAAISVMNAKLNTDVTDWKIAKIFPGLTTADTFSVSRVNDTVPIPAFWAAFRLFPSGLPDTAVAHALNSCQPEIWYAHPNYIVHPLDVPNDTYYNSAQASLHPTVSFPNAHINMEPAWDIEKGKSAIRVGVYDSGIDQTHPDLQGHVAGGYDYVANAPLSSPYDTDGHGTFCAGIIGASRDNSTGVAGIAGGDGTLQFDGVQLFDMRILGNPGATFSLIANAITAGAISVAQGGYGLHITSNSWGTDPQQNQINQQEVSLLKDAIRFAARNKVVFVAARGNAGTADPLYPACYNDEFVLNVGATGTNGEHKDNTNGDQYESSYGGNIDFCAPGTSQVVFTTEALTSSYDQFSGTSAACPHASGTAALMMSQNNQPSIPYYLHLQPEDIERIMQNTTTDISLPASPGYDQETGFGRINAGQALSRVDYPAYKVYHFGSYYNVNSYTIVPSLYAQNVIVDLPFQYQNIAAGLYFADIYKVTHTFTFNQIPPGETILDVWPRYNSSFGWSLSNPIYPEAWSNIVSFTNGQVVMENYFYHFINTYSTLQPVGQYLPSQQFATQAALSVLTFDPSVTGITESPEAGFKISEPFPNPANNSLNLYLHLECNSNVNMQVFDMQGRLVAMQHEGLLVKGTHTMEIQTAGLADGAYFLKVTTEKGFLQKKLLIVHQ